MNHVTFKRLVKEYRQACSAHKGPWYEEAVAKTERSLVDEIERLLGLYAKASQERHSAFRKLEGPPQTITKQSWDDACAGLGSKGRMG